MKRIFALLFGTLALVCTACEKHAASELPPEHETAAPHEAGVATRGHATGGHAVTDTEPVPASAPHPEATPGSDAPKFFPEKK